MYHIGGLRPLRELYPGTFPRQAGIRGQGRRGLQETSENRDGVRFHHQRYPDMHAAEPEQLGEHTYLQRRDTESLQWNIPRMEQFYFRSSVSIPKK